MTKTEKIYCLTGGESFTCAPNTTEDCTEKKGTTKSNSTMYFLVGAGIVALIVVVVLLVRYFMKRAT
jgi:hypothetical protein